MALPMRVELASRWVARSLAPLSAWHNRLGGAHLHRSALPARSRDVTGIDGSSPRVWGTLNFIHSGIFRARFIPTCVGNTNICFAHVDPFSVHPHVCGEHLYGYRHGLKDAGSSPRVWGTQNYINKRPSVHRFIPTCVGNTAVLPLVIVPVTVHPHVCGEHGIKPRIIRNVDGSSPRVWGILSI